MSIITCAENLVCGYRQKQIIFCQKLSLETSHLYCLLGANAAGKSTFLKTLCSLIKPLSGNLYIKNAAYVPQEYVSHSFSVLETVVMGRAFQVGLRSSPQKKDYDIAHESLYILHLEQLAKKSFNTLSGGQKRLVLTARALASQSHMLILDEPDSGLDAAHKHLLFEALRTCAQFGKIVLYSSHDIDSIRLLNADILFASSGKIEYAQTISAQKLFDVYGIHFEEFFSSNKNQKVFSLSHTKIQGVS